MRHRSAALTAVLGALLIAATPAAAYNESAGEDQVVFPAFEHDDAWMVDAGDVDGDGVGDIATAFGGTEVASDHVSVVFGRREGGFTGPADLDGRGYRIDGTGGGATPVGDVDGDGLPDLAVSSAGGLTVIFGGHHLDRISAEAPGTRGYRITGAGPAGNPSWGGSSPPPSYVAGLGDLDGNGRDDIAVTDAASVRVVYTPDTPGGATVDAASPGPRVGRLRLPVMRPFARTDPDAHIRAIDDVDGDGRREVAIVGGVEGGGVRVFGASAPAAGADIDVEAAVAAGSAFELRGTAERLDRLFEPADIDGDGSREFGLVVTGPDGEYGRYAIAVDPPPLGTAGDLAAHRQIIDRVASDLHPVGDQDNDGRADFAWGSFVPLSGGGRLYFQNAEYLYTGDNDLRVAASTADRDGDGRRELVVAENVPDGQGGRQTRYGVNYSGRVLEYESALPPVDLGDRVRFTATWAQAPGSTATGPVRVWATAQVRSRPDGPADNVGHQNPIELSGPGPFEIAMEARLPSVVLHRGQAYEYRVALDQAHQRRTFGPWQRLELAATAPRPETAFPPVAGLLAPPPPPTPQVPAVDRRAPVVTITALPRRARGSALLRGKAADESGGSGLARTQVGVVQLRGRRCRAYDGRRFGRRGRCSSARRRMVTVRVKAGRWRLRVRGTRPGRYEVRARATDRAGNLRQAPVGRVRIR